MTLVYVNGPIGQLKCRPVETRPVEVSVGCYTTNQLISSIYMRENDSFDSLSRNFTWFFTATSTCFNPVYTTEITLKML